MQLKALQLTPCWQSQSTTAQALKKKLQRDSSYLCRYTKQLPSLTEQASVLSGTGKLQDALAGSSESAARAVPVSALQHSTGTSLSNVTSAPSWLTPQQLQNRQLGKWVLLPPKCCVFVMLQHVPVAVSSFELGRDYACHAFCCTICCPLAFRNEGGQDDEFSQNAHWSVCQLRHACSSITPKLPTQPKSFHGLHTNVQLSISTKV